MQTSLRTLLVAGLAAAVVLLHGWNVQRASAIQSRPVPQVRSTVARQLVHGGATRTYRLHLPGANLSRSLPLVISLHGARANGRIQEVLTGFSPLADAHGFAVAYPDGLNGVWRFWNTEALRSARAVDDVGFIKALIDELVKQGTADPRRVYVTGISNGAFLTNRLGSELSDRIAAIAPVAGTMSKQAAQTARPRRPLPVLYIHGTEDRLVGFGGVDFLSKRQLSLSADDFVRWWSGQNGCSSQPQMDRLPDTANDGTTVERYTYDACKSDAEVVFYKIIGGGHTWPGGSAQPERLLGRTCRDFEASAVIWEFFSKAKLP